MLREMCFARNRPGSDLHVHSKTEMIAEDLLL